MNIYDVKIFPLGIISQTRAAKVVLHLRLMYIYFRIYHSVFLLRKQTGQGRGNVRSQEKTWTSFGASQRKKERKFVLIKLLLPAWFPFTCSASPSVHSFSLFFPLILCLRSFKTSGSLVLLLIQTFSIHILVIFFSFRLILSFLSQPVIFPLFPLFFHASSASDPRTEY